MDLEQFFESIDLSTVEGYCRDERQEDLFLEFKTIGSADLSRGPDQMNLARVLSGFANASGGITVWGVAEYEACRLLGLDLATASRFAHGSPRRRHLRIRGIAREVALG